LAHFLWERRQSLANKRVLELGSGTSLPGIVASKCGAQVILSDCGTLPKTLKHIEHCCQENNLVVGEYYTCAALYLINSPFRFCQFPGKDIEVVGLTWGLFLENIFNIGPLDLILGSDIFYDPPVFEDILVTVSFILEANPEAKFIFTYQERCADWSIEPLLRKWNLVCSPISLENFGKKSGVDLQELLGNHTIHLLEIKHQKNKKICHQYLE
jgi:predicted nicotinamide N-methyase